MGSTTRRTSILRKLSIYGFQAVEGSHYFHAFLEFDITGLRKALREARAAGRGGSLFAFLIKAIAVCLGEFPELNAMGNARRTTVFDEVDVSVPVEMRSGDRVYNKQLVIRDADRKSVAEIGAEIEASRAADDGDMSYLPSPLMRALVSTLPGFAARALIRAAMRSPRTVKASSGTVFVTSVSMFSNVPGFVLPYAGGPKACSFAVGSVVKKPVALRGEIAIREIVNIAASFNHDLVDGAPAARFIDRLRRLVESSFDQLLG